jgi:hypothetical protein
MQKKFGDDWVYYWLMNGATRQPILERFAHDLRKFAGGF